MMIEERLTGFTQASRLQLWLDVEAALARCQAELGMIPPSAAEAISKGALVANIDMGRYEALYEETKHPLVPLLELLREAVGPAAEYVHWGATTHDVVDIAKMMAMRQVWETTQTVLAGIHQDLVRLARTHADTLMAGRTHNIQAVPITFGFKAAVWAGEVKRDIERLRQGEKRIFAITFSGAGGTMASFGDKGLELERRMAREFDLQVPDIAWHAARDRFAELACTLAIAGGTLGRIAQEVYLLMGTEVAELAEGDAGGRVGSSTMPHKTNPIQSGRSGILPLHPFPP